MLISLELAFHSHIPHPPPWCSLQTLLTSFCTRPTVSLLENRYSLTVCFCRCMSVRCALRAQILDVILPFFTSLVHSSSMRLRSRSYTHTRTTTLNYNEQQSLSGFTADTVKPVYSGHPLGANQLAVIERWFDYTVALSILSNCPWVQRVWLYYGCIRQVLL